MSVSWSVSILLGEFVLLAINAYYEFCYIGFGLSII